MKLQTSERSARRTTPVTSIVHDVLKSSGQSLDHSTRAFMESRFGYDFAQVRIHTDQKAMQSAKAISARAYTLGNDVVFGEGQYSREGEKRKLIAHELTHVIQDSRVHEPQMIHRYESPEHQDLGNKSLVELFEFVQTAEGEKWAQKRGIDPLKLIKDINQDPLFKNKRIKVRKDLELTPGDIIALMGDFYATWRDLRDAPKKEVDEILKTIQLEGAGKVKNPNEEYEKITKGRFTKLAKINTKHFAPTNRETWKKMHIEALAKANKAGKESDEDAYQEALLIDAAGGHFLTDAFASGHLMDSSKVLIAITNYLKTNPIRSTNPEMQTVLGGLDMAGLAPSLVLKNIHDRMNQEGFTIANGKGMTWKTFGDNQLKNAEETRRVAAYAVFISRQQIMAAKRGEEVNVNEVLELLPNDKTIEQATDRAYAYIPDAVKNLSLLIHRNVGMLDSLRLPIPVVGPVLPFIGKSILGTISDPSRSKVLDEYDRRKQIDPSTPYPTPPLLKWEF